MGKKQAARLERLVTGEAGEVRTTVERVVGTIWAVAGQDVSDASALTEDKLVDAGKMVTQGELE